MLRSFGFLFFEVNKRVDESISRKRCPKVRKDSFASSFRRSKAERAKPRDHPEKLLHNFNARIRKVFRDLKPFALDPFPDSGGSTKRLCHRSSQTQKGGGFIISFRAPEPREKQVFCKTYKSGKIQEKIPNSQTKKRSLWTKTK